MTQSWRRAIGQRLSRSASQALVSPGLSWGLVGLGAILRLRQYVFNRSLWLDETLLGLNVLERPFARLLEPLEYNQQAPIGFLLAQKLAVLAFGASEYALRLFPLLAGIVSLFLLREVGRRCLFPEALPVALALFAFSGPLIYYSSEAKQYSSDVAIALVILAVALRVRDQPLTAGRTLFFAGLGTLAMWFSHPAAFVLAGVGLTLWFSALRRHDRSRAGKLLAIGAVWALSFAACFVLLLRHSLANRRLFEYWSGAFLPFPTSAASAVSFGEKILAFFGTAAGLRLSGIGILAFAVGCATRPRIRGSLALLLAPALCAIAGSALRLYPFEARFLLFLVPTAAVVMAQGADQIRVVARREAPQLGALFLALLLLPPLGLAARNFVQPRTHREFRPVLAYVRMNWESGDLLYGYRSSPFFRYYLPRFGFAEGDSRVGSGRKGDWQTFAKDLETLRGRGRVWVVFPDLPQNRVNPDVGFFLYYLDRLGTRLDSFEAPGAAAYLYQLGEDQADR